MQFDNISHKKVIMNIPNQQSWLEGKNRKKGIVEKHIGDLTNNFEG